MIMQTKEWGTYMQNRWKYLAAAVICGILLMLLLPRSLYAQTIQSQGQVQITAAVTGSAPTDSPVITSPENESRVKTTPLVVLGTCLAGLEVRIYNNQALAGTALCEPDGTFVINIGLLIGRNDLTAIHYDSFGQPSPESSITTVYVDEEIVVPSATGSTLVITETGVRIVSPQPAPGVNTNELGRLNVFTQVSRILGIGKTAGPVSTSETFVYATVIAGLSLYAVDLILFEASTTTKLFARLGKAKRLFRRR